MNTAQDKRADVEAANWVTIMTPGIGMGFEHIYTLKKCLKGLQERKSTHEAIGFLDAGNYEIKQKEIDFRIERMKAVINLLEVYKKSQETIEKIEGMKKNQKEFDEKIRGIIGF